MEMEIVELRGRAYNDGGIVPLVVEYGPGCRSTVSRAEVLCHVGSFDHERAESD